MLTQTVEKLCMYLEIPIKVKKILKKVILMGYPSSHNSENMVRTSPYIFIRSDGPEVYDRVTSKEAT